MKLYYSPGACSLASHIALTASGLAFEAIAAPTKTHKLLDGTDYYTINPLGYVPLLELDNGKRLREGPAILQYVADQAPAKKLAPAFGTFERYELQSWLTFISVELHKNFSPLFNPATPAETRTAAIERIQGRLKWLDAEIAGKDYLMGADYTVADAYLFTVTNWAPRVGLDLAPYANVLALRARIGARPAVQATLKAEGLA